MSVRETVRVYGQAIRDVVTVRDVGLLIGVVGVFVCILVGQQYEGVVRATVGLSVFWRAVSVLMGVIGAGLVIRAAELIIVEG